MCANSPLSAQNVLLGEHQNQISLHVSQAFSQSSGLYNFFRFDLRYSQPNEFFRLPGRRSIEIFGEIAEKGRGKKDDDSSYSNMGAGISQEAGIRIYKNTYAGLGLGLYIRSKKTESIDSELVLGERAFIGWRGKNMFTELYLKHYSNGGLTKINSGDNYYGLAAGYAF